MIKFIIPALIILLISFFWEKINQMIYKKFNIKLNYLLIGATLLIVTIIILLVRN
jgi:hypothetical protein